MHIVRVDFWWTDHILLFILIWYFIGNSIKNSQRTTTLNENQTFFSTGNETLCPPGKSSHTGFTPCEGKTRNFEIIRCKYLTLKIWYIYLIYSPNNFAINPLMHYFTLYIHRIIWKNKHTNSHTLWVMKLYKPFFTHFLHIC